MSRRRKEADARTTLEERLGPDVIKRLELMAGEFVRFERGQFGFYIDPARYAVKQRQVGPLGRGRRRKVVAGVDKDGNVITAWIGVDAKGKGESTANGEMVNIPDGYADGAATGPGGGKGRGKGKGKAGGGDGGGGSGDGSGGGGGGRGGGNGGSGGGGDDGTEDGTGDKKGPPNPGADATKQPQSAAEVAKAAAAKREAAGGAAALTSSAAGVGGPGAIAPGVPALPKPPAANLAGKLNEARGRKKKPLHWAKVPNNLLGGTVWTQLDDKRIPLDEDKVDELFGVDVTPEFEVAAEEMKPEVLPQKRKHNINILLANLKMTPDDIKDIVRVPTYKELGAETLQGVLNVCPNAEEEQLLQQNGNIRDQVDKTDAYMMSLADVKGLRGKIQCAVSAKTFNEDAVEVIRNMDTFAMIPTEIMNSSKLTHMLEAILAMGNFLNSGTGRGGAHGFKLEALAMLSTVKDAKGDTLLEYIVRWHLKEKPGILPIDDMPNLERSATISLEAIGDEVGTLIESVTNATTQINGIGDDASLAAFKKEMEEFAAEAVKVKDEIVSLRALMMEKLQLMMAHFGERNKAARGRQEDMLRMLREFQDSLNNVLSAEAEKEERAAKKSGKKAGGRKQSSGTAKAIGGSNAPAATDTPDSQGPGARTRAAPEASATDADTLVKSTPSQISSEAAGA